MDGKLERRGFRGDTDVVVHEGVQLEWRVSSWLLDHPAQIIVHHHYVRVGLSNL